MALKAVLPNLDGLDDALKPLYTQGEDGSFFLDIEDIKPHPSTKPLASTLEKYKRDLQAAKDAAKVFEGVDPERYRELLEQAEAAADKVKNGTGDEAKAAQLQLEKLKEKLQTQHQADLAKRDDQVTKRDAAIRKLVVDSALEAAITKAGVKPEYRAAVKALMREKKVTVVEDGDEYAGVFQTDLGDIPISEFVQSWSQGDEATHYLPADRKTGSGAPPGSGRSGGGSVSTFDANDPTAWGRNAEKLLKGEAKAI